ncbi:PREDICTED: uncharacterized protein LOC104698846 [Camelina sativa]|uniref:Uncharacterized protein LOC104698846 n=1 Tax=Camelina sativa TaxID=90675 RepID=A0ABM0SKN0_CAMSA|nr:PREDICTED: uncharacterized protein LOC104698846 [Camelina sativa]
MVQLCIKLEVIYESDELFSEIKKIRKIIPLSLLINILEVQPEAKFELFRVTNTIQKDTPTEESIDITYARLRKHRVVPDETKKVDWSPYYGIVLDQEDHDICWAIVAAELVRAIRWIRRRENGTAYSIQELIDFVDQEKAKFAKKGHFCYTLSIIKALTYIVKMGIQREVDRPFVGCRAEIYQGPMYKSSRFMGMHAVSVARAGVDEKTGESYMVVRSSHGEKIGVKGKDALQARSVGVLV